MIQINFSSVLTSVFSEYTSTEELKSAANAICAQVNDAYKARFAEIANKTKTASKPATAPAAPAKPEAKAKREKTAGDTDTLVAITDLAAIKKLGLSFVKYNDRCWVLRGETKPLRKILKEQFKGVFNSHLSGGEGWVIKTANVDECAKALGIKLPKVA